MVTRAWPGRCPTGSQADDFIGVRGEGSRMAEFYSKKAANPVDYAGTPQSGWRNSMLKEAGKSGNRCLKESWWELFWEWRG